MLLPLTLMKGIFPMALILLYLHYLSLLVLTLLMSHHLHPFMLLLLGLISHFLLISIKSLLFLSPTILMMIMALFLNHQLTLLPIWSLSALLYLLILLPNICMHLISVCRIPTLTSLHIMISPCLLLLDCICTCTWMLAPWLIPSIVSITYGTSIHLQALP